MNDLHLALLASPGWKQFLDDDHFRSTNRRRVVRFRHDAVGGANRL